ncbi:DinB family protein [Hugenholtzia roseola]|uniref:DinB family protein n=1 Tax=Hugenholtzia roseola TaxID=1002 RepID=UPI0004798176|nr:DinB family protein [Hugenholtzia roseola]
MMPAALAPTWQKLEESRLQLLSLLENKPSERFTQIPADEGWTLSQVLHHFGDVEGGVALYLQKKIDAQQTATEPLKDSGMATKLRYLSLKGALAAPVKIKAPDIVANVPRCTFEQGKAHWEKSRLALQAIATYFPTQLLGKEIFKHPLAGALDMEQTLSFIHLHHQHHQAQIKRLLEL